jgi:hypothetical protein
MALILHPILNKQKQYAKKNFRLIKKNKIHQKFYTSNTIRKASRATIIT